jgi:hypothetical protein
MIYEYRCADCASLTEHHRYAPVGTTPGHPCPICGGRLTRVYSNFTHHRTTFETHFNHTVGHVVGSHRQFADDLKMASDAESARTGQEHSYVPVDMRDRDACGVTDTGTDEKLDHMARHPGVYAKDR